MLAVLLVAYAPVIVGASFHGPPKSPADTSRRPVSLAPTSCASTEEVLARVRQDHEREVESGLQIFGRNAAIEQEDSWLSDDANFLAHSVGQGNAGPDEGDLENGDVIFQTIKPVLTAEECQDLVNEAREAIMEGLKEPREATDGRRPTNSELGEARVSKLPKARKWLQEKMQNDLFPLLESRFGLPSADLCLYDALIIGYGSFGGPSRSQPVHRDASLLSLNVALSPTSDYTGGGTYFEGLGDTSRLTMEQGTVICHAGGSPHAGRGTNSGERWVLVLFCLSKKLPQLARRCHALGEQLKGEGDLEGAFHAFQAGLSIAPADCLLHSSFASVLDARGDEPKARHHLHLAEQNSPHCPKYSLALGKMYMSDRRPDLALEQFERTLSKIGARCELEDPWVPLRSGAFDAQTYGAHAVILCAENSWDAYKDRLPVFVDHLRGALAVSPGNEYVLHLLNRAEKLVASHE